MVEEKGRESLACYGEAYQDEMRAKFYKSKEPSEDNTAYLRVVLAKELVQSCVEAQMPDKKPGDITLVDVGCAVGQFAIEFAKLGYRGIGMDFDSHAIEIARELNEEEGANARFIVGDVADWSLEESVDVALCFDIFEHLHDDELGAMLCGIRRQLSPRGCLVFHTLPLQYDYLFWRDEKGIIQFPWYLHPFKNFHPLRFKHLVEICVMLQDLWRSCRGKRTYKESIRHKGHCNPLTPQRLEDILTRAGYEIRFIKTGFLGESQLDPRRRQFFHKQLITHRSLWGWARRKW